MPAGRDLSLLLDLTVFIEHLSQGLAPNAGVLEGRLLCTAFWSGLLPEEERLFGLGFLL